MTKYSKFIIAIVLGILAVSLKQLGITPNSTVTDLVTALVTAAGVWFVPNE